MKTKITLIFFVALMATSMLAVTPTSDLSTVLTNSGLTFDLTLPGQNAIKGCIGDFNNDGKQDFIINGLYTTGTPAVTKGFLRIYKGQSTGAPILAYNDDNYPMGGNGAMDCYRNSDGSYLIAVQGGALGNFTNPFTANVFKLSYNGIFIIDPIQTLTNGAGRGNILFLDTNNDGYVDIFQNGWSLSGSGYPSISNLYINDKTNHFSAALPATGIPSKANITAVKGDINNDGKMDLAFAIQSNTGGAYVYINNGDNTFTPEIVTDFTTASIGGNIDASDDSAQLLLIDFNKDNYLDVAICYTGAYGEPWKFVLDIYKNNGNGTFTKLPQTNKSGDVTTFAGGQHADMVRGDFNNDGNEDIILGVENASDGNVWKCKSYILYGNGIGGYDQFDITSVVTPMSRRGNLGRFLTGDFNGDSKTDLITAGSDYYGANAGVKAYLNISSNVATSLINIGNDQEIRIFKNTNKRIEVILPKTVTIPYSLSIYNLSGQKVVGKQITSNSVIDTKLPSGVYIICINGNGENSAHKIVL